MLATKRKEIFQALEEADQEMSRALEEANQEIFGDFEEVGQKISEEIHRDTNIEKEIHNVETKIHANNLLCVYLVTTLEYCLKTAFEFNMEDHSWQNEFKFFCDQAGRFGYRETLKQKLKTKEQGKDSFKSLVRQRNNYIHQRTNVSASVKLQKEYFEQAKDIIHLIVETMPDRYVFKAGREDPFNMSDIYRVVSPTAFKRFVEPLAKEHSSSDLPNLELVIRIQNKKTKEQDN